MRNITYTHTLDRDILIHSIVNSLSDDEMVKFLNDLIAQLSSDVISQILVVREAGRFINFG